MAPEDVRANTVVTFQLPRIVTATDYHDFGHMQSVINDVLGLHNIYVTEVGFDAPEYVGLVHLDLPSHNEMVMQLTAYYDRLNNDS